MWGATMFDQLACRVMFKRLRYEGPFTPPSMQGTLVFPGDFGMFEWGGIAVDPVRQIAIANPQSIPFVSRLVPRGTDNPAAPTPHPPGTRDRRPADVRRALWRELGIFLSPLGIPCMQPPWGSLAAIDLKTNQIVWQHRTARSGTRRRCRCRSSRRAHAGRPDRHRRRRRLPDRHDGLLYPRL